MIDASVTDAAVVDATVGPAAHASPAALADLAAEAESAGVGALIVAGPPPLADAVRAWAASRPGGPSIAWVASLDARSTTLAEDVRAAAAAGAVGVRIEGIDWATREPLPADPCRALAAVGRPLLVPLAAPGDAAAIGAHTAPLGIAVMLVGAHYSTIRDDLAAAERYPHLHLETSALAHHRAVETAVGVLGSERLLFGSGAPARAIPAPLGAVASAPIPVAARTAILAGNAARLFGIAVPPVGRLPEASLPVGTIDVHVHLGPMPWLAPPAGITTAAALREAGIEVGIASSIEGIIGAAPAGNRRLVDALRRGDVEAGYLVLDPRRPDAAEEDIRRWGEVPGVVGAKIHAEWSETPTASEAMARVLRLAAAWGRPVLLHNDGPGWDTALRDHARRHPQLPIIIAHGGLGRPSLEGAALAADEPNVWLELASSFADRAITRAAVRLAGPSKILFGSDVPLLEPAFVAGSYRDAGVDPAAHPGVARAAAATLFGFRP